MANLHSSPLVSELCTMSDFPKTERKAPPRLCVGISRATRPPGSQHLASDPRGTHAGAAHPQGENHLGKGGKSQGPRGGGPRPVYPGSAGRAEVLRDVQWFQAEVPGLSPRRPKLAFHSREPRPTAKAKHGHDREQAHARAPPRAAPQQPHLETTAHHGTAFGLGGTHV